MVFIKLLTIIYLLTTSNSYILKKLNATSKQLTVYWGQDSAGSTSTLEKNLAYYCATGNYNTIIMAFMISFIDTRQPNCAIKNAPDLNFANHGNDCTTFDNCPFLLNCTSTIGVDIRNCQSKNVNILLSLGGAVGSYGFTSDTQGSQFANTIWNMFFEGTNNNGIRPFGNSILDGIDLDIEGGSYIGYGSFVDSLHNLMKTSTLKKYIITSAPQCVYPDAYMGPGSGKALTQSPNDFSWLNVQFYNNYCGVYSESQFYSSFEQWCNLANNNGFKILVGVPDAPKAGGGYVTATQLCSMVTKLNTYSCFDGFMMWDASWDMDNNNFEFSNTLKACLNS